MIQAVAAAFEEVLSRGVTITDLGDGSWWVRLAPDPGTEHEKSNYDDLPDPSNEETRGGRIRRSW